MSSVESFELSPQEVQQALAQDASVLLVDCREAVESEFCSLPGALCLPMSEIAARVDEVPRDRRLVVFCHHGMRSLRVTHWLAGNGYPQVQSMRGGIEAWSTEIDSTVPRYVQGPSGIRPLEEAGGDCV